MTGTRLSSGGNEIDRTKPLAFEFDGRRIKAFAGDTIASALLANGERIIATSFKYHRRGGIWSAGFEEPNGLVDVTGPGRHIPNVRATTEPAHDGLRVASVNAFPSARDDRQRFLDRLQRFIPAAFYYKTFMWPDWRFFEPRIRAAAGLGKVDPDWKPLHPADQLNRTCDVLVVGAGPAGLAAASQAAAAGLSVILADDQVHPGGSLRYRAGGIDGKPASEWVASTISVLAENGHTVLAGTTAFGIYDHNLVALAQRHSDGRPDTLWCVRPRRLVVATGAIERPLPFADNDLPGVMSADAALQYLKRFGVLVGRRILVVTNNGSAYEAAAALSEAGADVSVIDSRKTGDAPADAGMASLAGRTVVKARGKAHVSGVVLDDGTELAADCVAVSGGWTPSVHLYSQARGRLRWRDDLAAFVPGEPVDGIAVVGSASGAMPLAKVLESGAAALEGLVDRPTAPQSTGVEKEYSIAAAWPKREAKGRVWVDLQSDVTAKDVELAARENFVSVEHLKRYTTLGMATDQGKTSNLAGLALLAGITKRNIPEVGTTTYRPPFVPVPLSTLAGPRRSTLMAPLRRSPLEAAHRADHAVMQEYGGWLRPAFYGSGGEDAIQEEARRARCSAALFDGSALGKIEIVGPEAAAFLDFIYYNTMSTLAPGRCRYGLMLSESGFVFDDGVLMRLGDDRFIVSCSSSHIAAVHRSLEEWRQDRFDRRRLFIHDATSQFATVTVSGPEARSLMERLELGIDLDDSSLPHMSLATGRFDGEEVRVARVSFTGDRSYEISIRADRGEHLWSLAKAEGRALDAVTIGVEALMILRAEKGFIVIGKDTDGTTMPHDLGIDAPRRKRRTDHAGRRALFTEEAERTDRRQLVGLAVEDGAPPLATGAHGIVRDGAAKRSIGFVTSSYFSPTLGRPIALGLIERGLERIGETIDIVHLGMSTRAVLVPACAFDPKGERLHA